MATPIITNVNDPIITMVREYNVLLKSANALKSSDILNYLNNHAFPRIRGRLLTATDSTGQHVFYNSVGDLADSSAQQRADSLVIKVMTDSVVKDYIWRIAAGMAAAWATRMLAGQVIEQQKLGDTLEKQALDDLKLLITSPELTLAASKLAESVTALTKDGIPKIFLALDLDPSTYDAATNTAQPFSGAQSTGTATLWVGAYQITATVNKGDLPVNIMNSLLTAVRTYLGTNPAPAARFNLVVGPNEGPAVTGTRYIQAVVNGQTEMVSPTITTNIGWLAFHTYQMDPTVDALFCTLELTDSSGNLGIPGIVFGVMDNDLDYRRLSQKGPYSVFINVETGKQGLVNPRLLAEGYNLMDTFYFNIPNTKTTVDGVVRYDIANLQALNQYAPQAKQPRVIPIPAGSSALDVVTLIARDMEMMGFYHKMLPALRSPTNIMVMGTPVTAPGLQLVPYRPSGFEDRMVVDILEVPAEVNFGVLPPNLVTNGAFDNQPKSLVLEIQFIKQQAKNLSPLSTLLGEVRSTQANISDTLRAAMVDINFFNRGLF